MGHHKKQHTDEQFDSVTPAPFSLYNLFEKNLDVYRKIAKGFRLPMKEVSREMRDLESYQNINIHVRIPSADECSGANHTSLPLRHKLRLVHQRLGELRSPQYKIVSLRCLCDVARIESLDNDMLMPNRTDLEMLEMRSHFSTMRNIADFVQVQQNLTSVTFDNVYMTNTNARILGDMLRNSGVITTLRLRNLDFPYELPEAASDWTHFFQNGSSLTELEVSYSHLAQPIAERLDHNPVKLLSSATNLTSLTLKTASLAHFNVYEMLQEKEDYDFSKLTRLHTLDLTDNYIDTLKGYPDDPDYVQGQTGILAQLQSLTQLQTVILLDNTFNAEEINLFHNTYVNNGKTLLKLSAGTGLPWPID